MSIPVVVIRPYTHQDDKQVQKVIFEGTMAPVNKFFREALFREVFYQAIVVVTAIMFIFGNVKGFKLLLSIPIVAVIAYVGIWFAHYYKAKYLHTDLKDIEKTYMGSNKTRLFVAEAFYNDPPNKQQKPAFVTEIELRGMRDPRESFRNSEIIGTVGLVRDRNLALTTWLRRMAVKGSWRGCGVGSQLLKRAIKFASMEGFNAIDLITTECHDSAKQLYESNGFETDQFYHKKYFGLSGFKIMMFYMRYKTRPESALPL